jgi:ferredoxin hydrogenase large subunit/hydrogenase large subunit
LECKFIADQCAQWLDEMTPEGVTFTDFSIPESGRGYGLTEAVRGALGHWLEISASKIRNYQCVVPTTWNASPRDDRGVPGPMEQALAGLPIADPDNPMEAARVIRSFDPCVACAVH